MNNFCAAALNIVDGMVLFENGVRQKIPGDICTLDLGIEYLVIPDRLIGARIDQNRLPVYHCISRYRGPRDVAEVSRSLCGSRHGGLDHIAEMQLIFLPCEEEKGAVLAVVQLRNDDRSAKGSAVVVLAVPEASYRGRGSSGTPRQLRAL